MVHADTVGPTLVRAAGVSVDTDAAVGCARRLGRSRRLSVCCLENAGLMEVSMSSRMLKGSMLRCLCSLLIQSWVLATMWSLWEASPCSSDGERSGALGHGCGLLAASVYAACL